MVSTISISLRILLSPGHPPESLERLPRWVNIGRRSAPKLGHYCTPIHRIIGWAEKTGPNTAALVQKILQAKRHPEQGYRSCLGIMRLAGQYTPERVEAASHRAIRCNALGYKSVKSILECGLDRMPMKDAPVYTPPVHENVRGREYYEN
jgi:hypothetical protein